MIRAYLGWALVRVGYWLRPYDMLADRRRWFWQPAMRCGLPPSIAAAVQRAVVERMVCHHCGRLPEADGDHSCTCPHPDETCPDHTKPDKP
jgi:hypothetical protein